MRTAAFVIVLVFASLGPVWVVAQPGDAQIVSAIRQEGFERSQAMETVSWLSDVFGPRVTGTPSIEAAKDWAAERMRRWGLRVYEERFPYGRGWSLERFHAHLIAPQTMPIIGYPRAWTTSTEGVVTADVVRVAISSRDDLDQYRGMLNGKIVLTQPVRPVEMLEGDLVLRLNEKLLADVSQALQGTSEQKGSGGTGTRLDEYVNRFFVEEGVVAVLDRGSDMSLVGGAPLGSDLVWPTQRTDGCLLYTSDAADE